MAFESGIAQWAGTREEQNDAVSLLYQGDGRGLCLLMADGIGTDKLAGRAARTALQTMQQTYSDLKPGESLELQTLQIVGAAHRALLRLNAEALDQGLMSSGASVGCVLTRGEKLSFCTAGNVRVFLYRSGAMLQMNRDFLLSTKAETEAVLEGQEPEIEPDWNMRITAYAGMDGLQELDWLGEPLKLMFEDRIAVMSSGLFGVIPEKEWSKIMDERSPQESADEIVARVQEMRKSSQSNVSVAILRFTGR